MLKGRYGQTDGSIDPKAPISGHENHPLLLIVDPAGFRPRHNVGTVCKI
jgi:hypothetical protein